MNIIVGILNILHWASRPDYIEYIGLTPHVGTPCGTIPIYSNKEGLGIFFLENAGERIINTKLMNDCLLVGT
jgi:hypothetical protein